MLGDILEVFLNAMLRIVLVSWWILLPVRRVIREGIMHAGLLLAAAIGVFIIALLYLYVLPSGARNFINRTMEQYRTGNLLEMNAVEFAINPSLSQNASNTPQSESGDISVKYLKETGTNVKGGLYEAEGSYPIFGIEKLDQKIREMISTQMQIAKYDVDNTKNHIYVKFEKPYMDDKIISFELTFSYWSDDLHDKGSSTAVGINYDKTRDALYSIEDLPRITGLSLNKIAQKISLGFSKENYGEFGQDGIVLEPTIENLSNFTLDEKSVVFMFERYQILSGVAGSPRIPVQRISN